MLVSCSIGIYLNKSFSFGLSNEKAHMKSSIWSSRQLYVCFLYTTRFTVARGPRCICHMCL